MLKLMFQDYHVHTCLNKRNICEYLRSMVCTCFCPPIKATGSRTSARERSPLALSITIPQSCPEWQGLVTHDSVLLGSNPDALARPSTRRGSHPRSLLATKSTKGLSHSQTPGSATRQLPCFVSLRALRGEPYPVSIRCERSLLPRQPNACHDSDTHPIRPSLRFLD